MTDEEVQILPAYVKWHYNRGLKELINLCSNFLLSSNLFASIILAPLSVVFIILWLLFPLILVGIFASAFILIFSAL